MKATPLKTDKQILSFLLPNTSFSQNCKYFFVFIVIATEELHFTMSDQIKSFLQTANKHV